jgi:hypothetical protein
MCDYSLHGVASRPARVADALVTTRFNNFSGGFAAVGEPSVAVCLLPGTEIAFEKDAQYDYPFAWMLAKVGVGRLGRVGRFRQINRDLPSTHHDAIEFANGTIVLLTRLRAGLRASVLQLPAGQRVQGETEKPRIPVTA